jgi:hypothetical protein
MDERVLSELDCPAPRTSWTQTAIDTNTPCSIGIRMSVRRIVEAFVGRWDDRSHVFKKIREHLSLETTRGRCRNTVLHVEPCLFCLYTLILLLVRPSTPAKQRNDSRQLGRQDVDHFLRRPANRPIRRLG